MLSFSHSLCWHIFSHVLPFYISPQPLIESCCPYLCYFHHSQLPFPSTLLVVRTDYLSYLRSLLLATRTKMSLHPEDADSRAAARRSRMNNRRSKRVTMWPSPFEEEQAAPALPSWPGYRNSRRWTSTFDSEARATRMSFYVADSLLPPPLPTQPAQWAGGQNRTSKRQTWMKNMVKPEHEDAQPIWEGNFDVEKRASFVTRSARSSLNSEDSKGSWLRDSIDDEKYGFVKPRDPLTEEQVAQADAPGGLVPVDVLSYPYPGEGTADEPYMVSWIENDPANPLNFTKGRKWMNALILALAVWTVSIASSGFSQGMLYSVGHNSGRPHSNFPL